MACEEDITENISEDEKIHPQLSLAAFYYYNRDPSSSNIPAAHLKIFLDITAAKIETYVRGCKIRRKTSETNTYVLCDRFIGDHFYIIEQAVANKLRYTEATKKLLENIRNINPEEEQLKHLAFVENHKPCAHAILLCEKIIATKKIPLKTKFTKIEQMTNVPLAMIGIILTRYACAADGRAQPPRQKDTNDLLDNINIALQAGDVNFSDYVSILTAIFNYHATALTQDYGASKMPGTLLSMFYSIGGNQHHDAIGLLKQCCSNLSDLMPTYQNEIAVALDSGGELAMIVDYQRDGSITNKETNTRQLLNQ